MKNLDDSEKANPNNESNTIVQKIVPLFIPLKDITT